MSLLRTLYRALFGSPVVIPPLEPEVKVAPLVVESFHHEWESTGRYTSDPMFRKPISRCLRCGVTIPYPLKTPPPDLLIPTFRSTGGLTDTGLTCEEMRTMYPMDGG